RKSTRRRWVKVVAIVGGVGLLATAVMGIVIWQQKQEIEQLVKQKDRIDKEIQTVQHEMEEETDAERLTQLEEKLDALTGSAEKTIAALGKSDKTKAAEVVNQGDELDQHIRRILKN